MHERAFRALRAVYKAVDAQLGESADACRACGACCAALGAEHVLYASALEIAYLRACGQRPDAPRGPGVCPFLTADGRCGARAGRVLGCRTYFCTEPAHSAAEALHEKYLGLIRRICVREGLAWSYVPVLPALSGRGEGAA